MQRDGSRHLLLKVDGKGCLELNTRYKDPGSYVFACEILSVGNLMFPITIVDLKGME